MCILVGVDDLIIPPKISIFVEIKVIVEDLLIKPQILEL